MLVHCSSEELLEAHHRAQKAGRRAKRPVYRVGSEMMSTENAIFLRFLTRENADGPWLFGQRPWP